MRVFKVLNTFRNRYILDGGFVSKTVLSVLSGILLFLSFPPADISLIAWIALVPLMVAVKDTGYRTSAVLGFIAGTVFFGSLLYWLLNVSVPGTIILVLVLALFIAAFALSVRYVSGSGADMLLLPFVWVLLEYTRSFLFTGFPWGLLAYTQYANLRLIQIADLTGPYGVSFILVAFNAGFASYFLKQRKRAVYMVTALFFILISVGYSAYRIEQNIEWPRPRISVVQGNIPQEKKFDPRYGQEIEGKYFDLTHRASVTEPDMIIWPETSYPFLIEGDEVPLGLERMSEKNGIPVIFGAVTRDNGYFYNTAFLIDGKGGVQSYRKVHLVPFGEYVPFESVFPGIRRHIDKPIGSFSPGQGYEPLTFRSFRKDSKDGDIIRRTDFHKVGILICFEDIFPYIARNFVSNGADILVNLTNDAWFGRTAAAMQHLQASVFRAVENRVPLIRSANTGISGFIDATGRIKSVVNKEGRQIFVEGVLTDTAGISNLVSYYTVYGDVFVYFSLFMLVLILLLSRFVKEK
jgi:apolipoprotein N-acyltransferase